MTDVSVADDNASAPEATATSVDSPPVSRPDYLPEKFWDAEAGAPRIEEMARSYAELESAFGRRKEDLTKEIREVVASERPEGVPAKAEEYVVKLPDDFEVPAGWEYNISDDDPMVGWLRETAFASKWTQEQVNDAVRLYAAQQVANIPNLDIERQRLGENSKDRIERVDLWASKHLSENAYNTLSAMSNTANAITLMEEIMALTQTQRLGGDEVQGSSVDMEEIRSLMNTPEYYDASLRHTPKGREVRDKVNRAFASVYGDKPANVMQN